jgi:flagellar motor switch protein FliG
MILEGLDARSPELAELIRSKMFMFEDIVALEDRAMQLVLRQVEATDLATALKGAREDVRDKVMRNMSERGAAMLLEELDILPPQRRSVVEEAQGRIVAVIRKLEEAGALTISRDADEDDEQLI